MDRWVGRLEFNHEGDFWNAYLVDGAQKMALIGSVKFEIVDGKKDRMEAFVGLMQTYGADLIEARTGVRPQANFKGFFERHGKA